jgi:hypothetical protein
MDLLLFWPEKAFSENSLRFAKKKLKVFQVEVFVALFESLVRDQVDKNQLAVPAIFGFR